MLYMTKVTRDDVLYLAQLSSLQLDENEIEPLRSDIENIIGYVAQLDELDTRDVEPTYQVTDLQNVWREDVVDNYGISGESLVALSSDVKDNQIKVPKVLG